MENASPTSARLFSVRSLLLVVAWAVALFAVLQVHQFEDLFGHAICGPWGCGPPLSALVGYHGFWLILLSLPAWLLQHQRTDGNLRRLGSGLCLIAGAGIIVLLLVDGWQFLQRQGTPRYLGQWCLFRLATFVEFPLIQLGLIGLGLRNSQRPNPPGATAET